MRVITPDFLHLGFGVGRVVIATPSLVALENRNEETITVSPDVLNPLPVLLTDIITSAVVAIQSQISYMNAMAQLPFVRTFADLHDHMDANVLLINHVPQIFPRDAEGDTDPRQVDVENRVSEMVNAWLIQRWDTDPMHQPAPTEPEQIAGILLSMLNMSHEEQQWGMAKLTRFSREAGPNPAVRMEIDGNVFMVEVTKV